MGNRKGEQLGQQLDCKGTYLLLLEIVELLLQLGGSELSTLF